MESGSGLVILREWDATVEGCMCLALIASRFSDSSDGWIHERAGQFVCVARSSYKTLKSGYHDKRGFEVESWLPEPGERPKEPNDRTRASVSM